MFTLPRKSVLLRELLSQNPITLPTPSTSSETRKLWNLINPISILLSNLGLSLVSSGQTYFVNNFTTKEHTQFTVQDYLLTAKVLTELNDQGSITYSLLKERLIAQFTLYLNSDTESKLKTNKILTIMMPSLFEKNLHAIRLTDNPDSIEKSNKLVIYSENFKDIIHVWLKTFDSKNETNTLKRLLITLFQEKVITASEHPSFFTTSVLTNLSSFWEQTDLLSKAFSIEITPTYIWLMNGEPAQDLNNLKLTKIQRAGIIVASMHPKEALSAEIIREYSQDEFEIPLSKQESIDAHVWLVSHKLVDDKGFATSVIYRFETSQLI